MFSIGKKQYEERAEDGEVIGCWNNDTRIWVDCKDCSIPDICPMHRDDHEKV